MSIKSLEDQVKEAEKRKYLAEAAKAESEKKKIDFELSEERKKFWQRSDFFESFGKFFGWSAFVLFFITYGIKPAYERDAVKHEIDLYQQQLSLQTTMHQNDSIRRSINKLQHTLDTALRGRRVDAAQFNAAKQAEEKKLAEQENQIKAGQAIINNFKAKLTKQGGGNASQLANQAVNELKNAGAAAPKQVYANIQFEFVSSVLRTSAYPVLDAMAENLRVGDASVEIDGYSSSEETPTRNVKLSRDRANAVRAYLSAAGVDPAKLKVKAYGEANPIASNATEEGRSLNRRVEFRRIN